MFFSSFCENSHECLCIYIYNKKMKKGKVEKTALSFGSDGDCLVLGLGDRCGNNV